MMTPHMYDTQADSINVEDIVTNVNNRIVLERMRRNKDILIIMYCISKITTTKMEKVVLIMFLRVLKIWDGWGISLAKTVISRRSA